MRARFIIVFVAFVTASAARGEAASIVSGDGETWLSTLTSVCGGTGTCSGTTVPVTPHPAWADQALTTPAALWVSYGPTGVGDALLTPYNGSPENPDGHTPIMTIEEHFRTAPGSFLNVRFWADDTLDIYLNGNLVMGASFVQDLACTEGAIGCEPSEYRDLITTLTTTQNTLQIVGYQVGFGTNNVGNPFGVLYSGTVKPPPVPSPRRCRCSEWGCPPRRGGHGAVVGRDPDGRRQAAPCDMRVDSA